MWADVSVGVLKMRTPAGERLGEPPLEHTGFTQREICSPMFCCLSTSVRFPCSVESRPIDAVVGEALAAVRKCTC